MSEEKTIEELTAERDALIKANLEREIVVENQKIADAKKLEDEKTQTELYNTIKEKVIADMAKETGSVVLNGGKIETMNKPQNALAKLFANIKEKKGATGLSYENLADEMSTKSQLRF